MMETDQIIRGYRLEKVLSREMATTLYYARTEELWLPSEILIRLLPLPESFPARSRARFLRRFEQEARSLVRLRHPSLFPLFGYGEANGTLYLLMPCARGETLAQRLLQGSRWTFAEACQLLAPLAAVLDALHQQGLVYQFLNPTRIFLAEDQPPQITSPRLAQMVSQHDLDLPPGRAAGIPAHLRALDESPLGAPEYLAPEVVRGLAPDPRSDVYSLGILLFELLSGQPPFIGSDYLTIARKHLLETPPSLHERVPELPVALDILISRALHHDPRARFQSAGELAAACSRLLDGGDRTSSFSLLPFLIAQQQALPALESGQSWPRPTVLALPEPATSLGEEALPSSPEDVVADAWLNTPRESTPADAPAQPSPERSAPARPQEVPTWISGPVPGQQSASRQTSDPVTDPAFRFTSRGILI